MVKTWSESPEIPYHSAHMCSSKTITREWEYFLMTCLKTSPHKQCSWLKQTRTVFMHSVSVYLLRDDTFHCDICRINDYHSSWKNLIIFIDHIQNIRNYYMFKRQRYELVIKKILNHQDRKTKIKNIRRGIKNLGVVKQTSWVAWREENRSQDMQWKSAEGLYAGTKI